MVEEVIWSPLAVETYDSIIKYLLEKFGEASVQKFVQRVGNKILLIASRPTMFRLTGQRPNTYITSYHKSPINKQREELSIPYFNREVVYHSFLDFSWVTFFSSSSSCSFLLVQKRTKKRHPKTITARFRIYFSI
jgi:plasmid stabilization system protein ParE